MQGSSGLDRWRRIGVVSVLVGGLIVGASVLGALLWGVSEVFSRWGPVVWWLPVLGAVLLGIGDVWAILTSRHYPLGLTRQTAQSMLFSGHGHRTVGFLWGLDAGLGITTYRITSGTWVVALYAALGRVEAWSVLLYALGFGAALLVFIARPIRVSHIQGDTGASRALKLVEYRRFAQALYLGMLVLVVVSTVAAK